MRFTHSLIAAALLLGACSPAAAPSTTEPERPGEETPDTTGVAIGGGVNPFLVAFDSCEALLSHIKTEAAERVGPYGLDTTGWPWPWFEGDVAMGRAAEADSAGSPSAGPAQGDDSGGGDGDGSQVTGTNVQELGVDEPDVIKADGDRILAVSENVLSYIDLSGEEAAITDQLDLEEGWNHELFFEGDRAFLFTNGSEWGPSPAETIVEDAIRPHGGFQSAVTVLEVDISDPAALSVTRSLRIEGQYLSARSTDGTIRMAMNTPPTQLPWVFPSGPSGEARAEETNRELVMETTIEDWIPDYEIEGPDGDVVEGALLDCSDISRPSDFSGFDFVSVLTFDLAEGLTPGAGVGVLASGQQVYASLDRFYVATTRWAGEEIEDDTELRRWSESYTTSIHAFDNTADGATAYLASAEIDGSLLNQFSMDEHDGYLRVVTTEGSPWDERDKSETFLTVFGEQGDELVEVGRVGGLGKGETLFSARLLDDVGFAVTFRQIDPFYVIDLSDPTDPRVTGELKIPGFSTYLHPVGDDLVIGIGQDATEDGQVVGFKVSLFSVADPTAPVEIDTWTLAEASSPAEHDHRAFQFLPDQNLAIVPVAQWNGDVNGAVLLEVTPDGLTERGTVTQVQRSDGPTTDCRKLDGADFPEDTELYWMASDGVVLYCEDGQDGGYGDFACDPIPIDDLGNWFGSPDSARESIERLGLSPEGRLEMCWPDDGHWRQQIQRSLIIGDTLWTMSPSHLQANDLATLDVTARLAID